MASLKVQLLSPDRIIIQYSMRTAKRQANRELASERATGKANKNCIRRHNQVAAATCFVGAGITPIRALCDLSDV